MATLVGGPPEEYDSEARAIRNVGAKWIRIIVPWNLLEPEANDYHWDAFDAAVNAATAAGLSILILISGPAPVWARLPGANPLSQSAPPADPPTFGGIAGLIADRYKSSVSHWEIWNEPNIPNYFWPLDVPLYASMLKSAYANIHGIQPEATVISGGLSPAPNGIDPPYFVEQLYAEGAGDSFDALALHPYTLPYSFTQARQGGATIEETHRLMVERGQGWKKIWMTEYGQATGTSQGAVSPERQSDILLDFLLRTTGVSYLGPSFLFTSRDLSDDPGINSFNYGLYTFDYEPKPVVTAIRARA